MLHADQVGLKLAPIHGTPSMARCIGHSLRLYSWRHWCGEQMKVSIEESIFQSILNILSRNITNPCVQVGPDELEPAWVFVF